ncbi:Oligopeptide transport system permease protein OppC [Candidatus Entotheonellaceae bacterium PAL068K]
MVDQPTKVNAQTAATSIGLDVRTPPPQGLWRTVWQRFLRHRLAVGGMLILILLSLGTLFGPLVYQRPIDDIDFAVALHGPSLTHPMGTDDMGQDILARIMYGGRVSMAVGLTSMCIAILLGTVIGAVSGYGGGSTDNVLMRLTDLFLALPTLPLLLIIVYLFRDIMRRVFDPELGIFLLIVTVIGGLRWMQPARLVRATILSLKEKEFVEAAHAIGTPPRRLVMRHLLPNAMSPVIVAASLGVGQAILAESALSFLGLGFPPDMPTWGRLLLDARDFLDLAPHWAIFPGTMIFLAVLSFNYVGDGLRDALDARKVL